MVDFEHRHQELKLQINLINNDIRIDINVNSKKVKKVKKDKNKDESKNEISWKINDDMKAFQKTIAIHCCACLC